jgi:hypothetical protein
MPSDRHDSGLFLMSHGFASGLPPFARESFGRKRSFALRSFSNKRLRKRRTIRGFGRRGRRFRISVVSFLLCLPRRRLCEAGCLRGESFLRPTTGTGTALIFLAWIEYAYEYDVRCTTRDRAFFGTLGPLPRPAAAATADLRALHGNHREPPEAASARASDGKSGVAFRSARYGAAPQKNRKPKVVFCFSVNLAMMAPRDAASWPSGPRSRVGWRQRAKATARSCRNAAPPLENQPPSLVSRQTSRTGRRP